MLKKINKIKNIFIDIDNTITDSIEEKFDPFKYYCVKLMMEKKSLSRNLADKLVDDAFNVGNDLIEPILEYLRLPILEYCERLVGYYKKSISVFPDADFLLKELKKQNFNVYPATTNSSFAILTKIAVGGLAKDLNTPYFKTLMGGSEVHPEGKSGPFFYIALMEKLKVSPETVLMIGDSREADADFAIAAGIKDVVIIDRAQEESISHGDQGEIIVNSLEKVVNMLKGNTGGKC